MTTVSTPRSAIAASSAWSAGAFRSGQRAGQVGTSMRMPMVPISPATRPPARSPDSTRYVVVVFPDVP